ncbi:MAG: BrnT family toxin [Calditrichaceae bacterium]|nr:BrnT family toxin [Calditrichaceae bacterium]MBN2708573.1 BrnT family toxin [Calditrichaceae bacterium]RQV96882.1 MAG: BrnT family toxin [Calditrichota bacterium]
MNYNFEWDPDKEKGNLRKHKVSFENAATIFTDPLALTLFDNDHSKFEDRWITMGISGNGNILVVIHTFKEINENNTIIRIISARKATKREIQQYQGEGL